MKSAFSKELKYAINAAKGASKIALEYFYSLDKGVKEKSVRNLVTNADIECENYIKQYLLDKFPDHGFLGEETEKNINNNDFFWVVDPIDGTNNFACGLPIFCHSIALVKKNMPVLGVVYDPIMKDLFFCKVGEGAYLNNKKLSLNYSLVLKDCLIGTGFPYADGEKKDKTAKAIHVLSYKSLGIRRLGSAVLDICYVARNVFGGVFFYELQPWDVSAAYIIAKEAGAVITDINGKEADIFAGHFIICHKDVHKDLLNSLERI
ncbi:MAG: inositol monophosphatase [Candidatus Diapherotrites archaeon]|nr:inositol monophosphatase [Candidatus Diapherotrites archaeon]